MTFLRWVGGKSNLKHKIINQFPKEYTIYIEPFIGSGAVFFELKPTKSIISDINENLINSYKQVKNNCNELIKHLVEIEKEYTILTETEKRNYYNIKKDLYNELKKDIENNKLENAILFIFLNKTCFNGIYRENRNRIFNVPFGTQKKVNIIDIEKIKECSKLLQNTEIYNCSYSKIFEKIKQENLKDCLIYLDPPYMVSNNSKFTSYTSDKFLQKEQEELNILFKEFSDNHFIFQSNSHCDFILEKYKNYSIEIFDIKRSVNSKIENRKNIKQEVLIFNKK